MPPAESASTNFQADDAGSIPVVRSTRIPRSGGDFLAGTRVRRAPETAVVPTRAERVGTEHEEPTVARARSFGNIRKLLSGRYQARSWRLGKQVAADTTEPPWL